MSFATDFHDGAVGEAALKLLRNVVGQWALSSLKWIHVRHNPGPIVHQSASCTTCAFGKASFQVVFLNELVVVHANDRVTAIAVQHGPCTKCGTRFVVTTWPPEVDVEVLGRPMAAEEHFIDEKGKKLFERSMGASLVGRKPGDVVESYHPHGALVKFVVLRCEQVDHLRFAVYVKPYEEPAPPIEPAAPAEPSSG
mgnify:CR=1 FL=1